MSIDGLRGSRLIRWFAWLAAFGAIFPSFGVTAGCGWDCEDDYHICGDRQFQVLIRGPNGQWDLGEYTLDVTVDGTTAHLTFTASANIWYDTDDDGPAHMIFHSDGSCSGGDPCNIDDGSYVVDLRLRGGPSSVDITLRRDGLLVGSQHIEGDFVAHTTYDGAGCPHDCYLSTVSWTPP